MIQHRGHLFIPLISPISMFSTDEMKCLRVVSVTSHRTGGGLGVRTVKEHMCCNGNIGLSGRRTARVRGGHAHRVRTPQGGRGGGLIERGSFALGGSRSSSSSSAAPAAVDPPAHVAWRGALPLRCGRPGHLPSLLPSLLPFLPSFIHGTQARLSNLK